MNTSSASLESNLTLSPEQQQELLALRQQVAQIDAEQAQELANLDQEQVRVLAELHSKRTVLNNQIDELLELNFNLQRSFGRYLQKRKQFGLSNEGAPSPEQLQDWLTPEREAAIKLLQEPVTLWIPAGETFEQRVVAIDNSGLAPTKTYVDTDAFKESAPTTEALHGHLAIVDGAQEVELLEADNAFKKFSERIELVQAYREARNLIGFDRDLASALYLHSLPLGKPTDAMRYTLLDADKACEGTAIPDSDWHYGQMRFRRDHSDFQVEDARFRSAVRGDVETV